MIFLYFFNEQFFIFLSFFVDKNNVIIKFIQTQPLRGDMAALSPQKIFYEIWILIWGPGLEYRPYVDLFPIFTG